MAMFILVVTPGPGVFATVAKALVSGFKLSIPVIIGIIAGDLIFLLIAIYGLHAIAETFSTLFTVIKYFGSAYLIWYGLKLWQSGSIQSGIPLNASSGKFNFLSGLSITLGNPKVILFYLGFLPTFLELDKLSTVDIAIIVSFVLASVLLFYAYTAFHARQLFESKKANQNINKIAGTVMIGTGSALLSKT
ncbi:MAG: LysE family translocator [Deltaproteobacteria bacterium]|nr:LysE family translocator [Deltaproteobacteria bacterium]